MIKCSLEICQREAWREGYCATHYKYALKVGILQPRPLRGPSVCTVDGCDLEHYGRGYCRRHYQRVQYSGSPGLDKPFRSLVRMVTCEAEGCNREAFARRLCVLHYKRLKTLGSLTAGRPGKPRTGYVSGGYRYVWHNGRIRREHHVVMEQVLQRPMLRHEIVHHIDGDKLNNAPSNLEVLTRRTHMSMHNIIRGLAGLDEKAVTHLNGHLRQYGITVHLQPCLLPAVHYKGR